MLLDLTDEEYLRSSTKLIKESEIIESPYKYANLLSRWFHKSIKFSYVEYIMNEPPRVHICDRCGVILNSVNTKYDWRYIKAEGYFCIDCDIEIPVLNNSFIDDLNRPLRRIVFEELLVHIQNLNNNERDES